MKMKLSNSLSPLIMTAIFIGLVFILSCQNDDADCYCDNNEFLVADENEKCKCKEEYHQIGMFSTTCESITDTSWSNHAFCYTKEKYAYKMYLPKTCKCSDLTFVNEAHFVFQNNYFTVLHPYYFYSDVAMTNYDNSGLEFEIKGLGYLPQTSDNFLDCNGDRPGTFGYIRGKFNTDNTYCETYLYWYDVYSPTEDDIPLDSCKLIFTKDF